MNKINLNFQKYIGEINIQLKKLNVNTDHLYRIYTDK